MERVINFNAGPATLPLEVLHEAQEAIINYKSDDDDTLCGMGVMEMSHRSLEFTRIMHNAQQNLRSLLHIPDAYEVLFMPGGGTGQFSAIPLNLLNEHTCAAYVISGTWSAAAAKECEKYATVHKIASGYDGELECYTHAPQPSQWQRIPSNVSYVYMCANETVSGVEFDDNAITFPPDVPIVADFSSSFLSRNVDVSRYGLIFAGAQKNVGPAGVTIVIVRRDLLGRARHDCPVILNYKAIADKKSAYNTPPCWNIFVVGLMFKWLLRNGGVMAASERNTRKAQALYETLDSLNDFYVTRVRASSRSRMNVVFRIQDNVDLETQFVKEAKSCGMVGLAGHRSVGGIRASLYNATTEQHVRTLCEFVRDFAARHSSQSSQVER